MMWHTEMCEGCEVTSGRKDIVQRVTVQSDVVMQTDQRKKRSLSRSERSRSSDSLKDHLAEEVHDQLDNMGVKILAKKHSGNTATPKATDTTVTLN